jgi:acetyl esterase
MTPMSWRGLASVVALVALLAVSVPAAAQRLEADAEYDVEYARPDGIPLLLDVYRAPTPGPHPAVLMIHGGRWYSGDKADVSVPAATLSQEGFVVVAVNYRLAPDHPYPAAIEDLQAAVTWIRDHADEYDVDPARVIALGGSAGGHLAALLASMGSGPIDTGSRVMAGVSWSGPMDLVRIVNDELRFREVVRQFLGCSRDESCELEARVASPIYNLDADDPPIFLANGTDEAVEHEHLESMADELEEKGIPHQVLTVPGPRHAFQYYRVALPLSAEFIRQVEANPSGLDATVSPTEEPTPRATGQPDQVRDVPSRDREGLSVGFLAVLLGLGIVVVGSLLAFLASRAVWPFRRGPAHWEEDGTPPTSYPASREQAGRSGRDWRD